MPVAHRVVSVAPSLLCILGAVIAAGCQPASDPLPPAPTGGHPPSAVRPAPEGLSGHERMVEVLWRIRQQTPDTIAWLGDSEARQLRQAVAQLSVRAPMPQHFMMRKRLAELELRLGNEEEAIALLRECERIAQQSQGRIPPEQAQSILLQVNFDLGVAQMRLAETQNCCARNTADSCVVPIRGGGLHTNASGSLAAIDRFEFVLENTPQRSLPWLRALWLYNIAKMTLGEYPEEVASSWRLPPELFRSQQPLPEFRNVGKDKGLNTFSLAGGAIGDDFDRDGDIDLIVSTMDTGGPLRLFCNDGEGGFVQRTGQANLDGLLGGLNLVQADFNNDGFLDVLVLRGGWFQEGGRHPNSLLKNNGDGTFTDVTFDAGMTVYAPTQTGAWADYDNDGDLDLYVGNEATPSVRIDSQLYRNNADGTFTDVAAAAGVANEQMYAKAVVWGDYDHDGLADLYVSNFGKENRLYRNLGGGKFVDVAPKLHVTGPLRSFPAWFWDFNNDGHLDIFVSGYASDIAYQSARALGMKHDGELPALYEGDGKGGFVQCGKERGLTMPVAPMGSNYGDLENDGDLDFYLGTGEPEYQNLMPNVMYRNENGERFTDVTMAGRLGHLQKGHAVVFADFDRDGDADIFQQIGGAFPGDRYFDAMFENPGPSGNWIGLTLIGVQSSRCAIGARVHLRVESEEGMRSIFRHVSSGGSFGANPLSLSIGVGQAERIESMEIFWPATGERQIFRDLPANQSLRIVEGAPRPYH